MTDSLKKLIKIAEKRISGKAGDSVIQLKTPFGGGKTHTLIALYHKADQWGAKRVVIDGASISPKDKTLWAILEEQLTGKVTEFTESIPPGKEKINELLREHHPVMILMDEVLHYADAAEGIKIGDSNLAKQTILFMQQLTEAVKATENCLAIITLPASMLEHSNEELFQRLQKVIGRIEHVYTPVSDNDIPFVVNRRLFSKIDKAKAKKVVDEFIEYAEAERLIDKNELSSYRDRFLDCYPFQPDVIDCLYQQWGTFPTFQRTRGVLRLLALVIYSLKNSSRSYIRLGDFDLSNQHIRDELIKHIRDYDPIIASDITGEQSGAKKVDNSFGDSLLQYKLGTTTATSIFMLSFSGKGQTTFASPVKVKLSSTDPAIPSSNIDTAITKLKESLFYLDDRGLCFSKQPNLNKVLLEEQANIPRKAILAEEKDLLKQAISRDGKFKVYIWPENTRDIPDTEDLALIILKDQSKCKEFVEQYGLHPRVCKNRLIFLCPMESQETRFESFITEKLAWEQLAANETLHVTDEQKAVIKDKVKKCKSEALEYIRGYYRTILLPSKNGEFETVDMGTPTYGGDMKLDKEVFERLQDKLISTLTPLLLKQKYLSDNEYVEIEAIYMSSLNTPGEIRLLNRQVLRDAVAQGVKQGLFGFGRLEDNRPICDKFKESCNVTIGKGEIIIAKELCEQQRSGPETEGPGTPPQGPPIDGTESGGKGGTSTPPVHPPTAQAYSEILLQLKSDVGTLANLASIVRFLNTKFTKLDIELQITASEGRLTQTEYEDKILETITQAGITLQNEVKKT